MRDEDVYVGLLVSMHEYKFFVKSLNGLLPLLGSFLFLRDEF